MFITFILHVIILISHLYSKELRGAYMVPPPTLDFILKTRLCVRAKLREKYWLKITSELLGQTEI